MKFSTNEATLSGGFRGGGRNPTAPGLRYAQTKEVGISAGQSGKMIILMMTVPGLVFRLCELRA
jgi:hypothetical protein